MRLFLALILIAPLSTAQDLQSLQGLWGTPKQCAGALITETGTKRAAPFDIRQDWLGHGDVWCRLNWISVQLSENGVMAFANAVCSEDMERDYKIGFELSDETLTISWNFEFQNGPIRRCL